MLVNAFVGGMVGVERVVLPIMAEQQFGLASRTAILSFLVSFGLIKAAANLFAGRASDRLGRKSILVAGWLFGLPVPLLIAFAPSWGWIVFANVLLGINQGFCWSTTVIMKIDLVGRTRRGLAMGLNEASGYLTVSIAAFAAGTWASSLGIRIAPAILGGAFVLSGLFCSVFLVRETHAHARLEATQHAAANPPQSLSFFEVFRKTSWTDRNLMAVSQAGLVNNLNDGMAWGLLPLYFAARGLSLPEVSFLGSFYPAVWSLAQLGTGALSDRFGRKGLIAGGMVVQAAAIGSLVVLQGLVAWAMAAALLGLGTAMVYPTLLAAIGDVAHPSWRASALGVYRLWRDSGYAVGALFAGTMADTIGMTGAIVSVGGLTLLSGIIVLAVMKETHRVLTSSAADSPTDPRRPT
ncbi:MAG TPA: MFS transporter [Candidatus Solibacter sp.]|nr:MFS transporter [Candidatus Solibacter sp.]